MNRTECDELVLKALRTGQAIETVELLAVMDRIREPKPGDTHRPRSELLPSEPELIGTLMRLWREGRVTARPFELMSGKSRRYPRGWSLVWTLLREDKAPTPPQRTLREFLRECMQGWQGKTRASR